MYCDMGDLVLKSFVEITIDFLLQQVCFDLSEQKWKSKGMIKNKVQKWQDEHVSRNYT